MQSVTKTKTQQHKNILSLLFVFYAAFVPQFRNTSTVVSTLDADGSAIVRTVVVFGDLVRSRYSPVVWVEQVSERY